MSQLLPIVRHVILCEDVVADALNPRRVSVIGILSAISSEDDPAYPVLYEELCIFLQLTGCRGPGDIRIDVQFADTGDVAFQNRTRTLQLPVDPLEIAVFVFRIRNCLFLQPGLYWVRVWYNNQQLAQQPLVLK